MAITNGYATLAQVKAALRITDAVDDELLELATESASRAIDSYCNRVFYSSGVDSVRDFTPNDTITCDIDDAASITSIYSLDADGETYTVEWATTDYQLEPLNGLSDSQPVPYNKIRAVGGYSFLVIGGEATVRVTGVFGYPSIPTAITQAAVIQASRIFKRLDSPLGIISGELGSMRVGTRLDPDVAQLVDSHRKIRMA